MTTVAETTRAAPIVAKGGNRPPIGHTIASALSMVILFGYSIFVFLPFVWSVITSFKTLPDSLRLTFIPNPFTTYGYTKAFTQLDPNVVILFFNSALIAAIVTATNILLGALGGYAFARLRFPGREVLFLAVLGTMMIPDQLRLVPVYQILTALHLVAPGPENYLGVILILAVSATSLFIMRQFFLTVHEGGGAAIPTRRDVTPGSDAAALGPALAAVAILSFQGSWNGFFWPLVILQYKGHWTLPLGITQFRFLYSTDWPPLMALTVIATIPIVVLYVFFQRYFVGGTVSAAVKG